MKLHIAIGATSVLGSERRKAKHPEFVSIDITDSSGKTVFAGEMTLEAFARTSLHHTTEAIYTDLNEETAK